MSKLELAMMYQNAKLYLKSRSSMIFTAIKTIEQMITLTSF